MTFMTIMIIMTFLLTSKKQRIENIKIFLKKNDYFSKFPDLV